ncbi:MAG: hypothetical protein U9M90_03510 [Patescibacteria group bacterium]|nr:hypothetical protein [Patescibacteria group bacterium]
MHINKKIIITALVLGAISLAGVLSASAVWANNVKHESTIQRLADRFNLNKDEVKDVFEQQRTERREIRKERRIKRLDDAVKNGQITEEQKTLILEKMEELRKETAEKRGEFREHREEMEKWARDNGIDIHLLGRKHRTGHFRHFRSGWLH